MNHYVLFNTRQLDLQYLDLEKSSSDYILQSCEQVFDPQPSVKNWLSRIRLELINFLKSCKIQGPVGFILPESIVINIVVPLSYWNGQLSIVQQLTRALDKDFGIRGDKVIFRYKQIACQSDTTLYWVSLIPKKFWTSLKTTLSLCKTYCPCGIDCFPPIAGHAAYFNALCRKNECASAVAVFFEKDLTRFFARSAGAATEQSCLNFLDLRKLPQSDDGTYNTSHELRISSRYFSHSLNVQSGAKDVFVFGDEDTLNLDLGEALFGNNVRMHVVNRIEALPNTIAAGNLSEQALFLGLLKLLDKSENLDDFNFLNASMPLSLFDHCQLVARKFLHNAAVQWFVLCVLLGSLIASLHALKMELKDREILTTQKMKNEHSLAHLQWMKDLLNVLKASQNKQAYSIFQKLKEHLTAAVCVDSIKYSVNENGGLTLQGRCKDEISVAKLRQNLMQCFHESASKVNAKLKLSSTASSEVHFTYQVPIDILPTV